MSLMYEILERVEEDATAQLGLEPGALGGHGEAGVADGHHLLHLRRIELDGGSGLPAVDAACELGGAVDAADEVDALVAARIGDAEDGAEDLVLADLAVEALDRIG